jgi:hypothetical protein
MTEEMKLTIDGIAYTAVILDKTGIDFLGFQGPIELQLKRYADQEYYAPLPKPFPISGVSKTNIVHAGGLYCYAGFGVFAIPFEDAPLHPYEATHLGDINEDIISHLAMAGNTVIAKIEIVVT